MLGSGAEIEGFNDFQSSLAAKTAERISDTDQQEADRLAKMQLDEALRLERAEDNNWSRNFSLAQLLADQDPSNAILQILGTSSNLTKEQANAMASFLKNNYERVSAPISGGSGGSTFTPVVPKSSAVISNLTPTSIASNYSSNAGWADTISALLS